MTNPQAEVTEGLASSVFNIATSASIPSDNLAIKNNNVLLHCFL